MGTRPRPLRAPCLLDFMVRRDVEAGRLRVVLENECVESRPLYAVQPFHRHPSAKVRAFVDFLVEELRAGVNEAGSERVEYSGAMSAIEGGRCFSCALDLPRGCADGITERHRHLLT